MRNQTWKWVVIALVVGWAVWQAFPTESRPVMNMALGLDLKGGSHIVLKVNTDEALTAEADSLASNLQTRMSTDEGFTSIQVRSSETGEVVASGVAADQLSSLQTKIEEQASGWSVSRRGDEIVLRLRDSQAEFLRDRAVKQALNTLTNRIDNFGVAEPVIQRLGQGEGERILVQLPGVEDSSRMMRLIKTAAVLEIKRLYYDANGQSFYGSTREEVLAMLGGTLPPSAEILEHKERPEGSESGTPPVTVGFVAVDRAAIITGSDLSDARRSDDQWARPSVSFTLRIAAAKKFAAFTEANVQRQIATILDNEVTSIATIIEQISTNGQISDVGSAERAEEMALILRSGALPASIDILEERTVGPSLGRDSIIAGIWATTIGFVAVMIFMLIYYKLSGVNAVVALLLNLLLVAAAMASMGATLTLPGIGGFILTVGMAVDANVLIFERIREELRAGKTVRGALDAGFSKAFSAIIDANLTTLIAALFLFNYGTGPVRGFAATLSIGIVASLFTAIFVSRAIFDFVIGTRSIQKMSI